MPAALWVLRRGTITDKQEIEQVLRNIAETVSKLDVGAWLDNFHNPRLIVSSETSYSPANESECREFMGPYFQNLREKGFTHTKINTSQIRMLTDATAIVTTTWTRYADSEVLENIGATYMFQKSDNIWRAIMVTSYPSDTVVFG